MSSSTTINTRQPINYVFVDYENVPDVDLSFVADKTVHLTLLIGSRQTKASLDQVEHLMKYAATTALVRLESSGKNSLDFSLAYYLGRAVQSDPTAYFHIISKDTGFHPLIEHLKARHISVRRHDDGSKLTFSAPREARSSALSAARPHCKGAGRPAEAGKEPAQEQEAALQLPQKPSRHVY